jgi:hypothetical protein
VVLYWSPLWERVQPAPPLSRLLSRYLFGRIVNTSSQADATNAAISQRRYTMHHSVQSTRMECVCGLVI